MTNYAKPTPRDNGGQPMQDWPAPVLSQEQYLRENGIASSLIALQPQTSQIEVSTIGGQGAVIRWIPKTEPNTPTTSGSVIASGLGVNFDHHIPPNLLRQFVVPRETAGAPTGQLGSVNGLYQRVAVSNAGATASSILVVEY